MNYFLRVLVVLFSLNTLHLMSQNDKVVLAIHGGAGTILKKNMTPEKEKAYHEKLAEALKAGYTVLQKGGTSLDAVEAAIVVMEDSPLFNAGKGSVFNSDGKNEMDAAIMDGSNLKAGAVAGVHTIKNPIKAARAVMEKSEHVMLIGDGAEKFAQEKKLEIVEPKYFYDEYRYQQYLKAKEQNKIEMDHTDSVKTKSKPDKHGTVGAVALDNFGNISAATSTGGMTNKKYGRVGDAPIIGAGTYANNNSCAVSCTGHGEFFIRAVVGHEIASLIEHKNLSVKEAAEKVILEKMVKMGGEGGAIVLDNKGNVALPFNTEGMYRGYITKDGKIYTGIYKGD
ncbi:MAG TPA: isoaspartyl peptidase/L-asparaginase [Bacteroidia bacterium]|nr:isoaspartyl peptidase/L-asparaginase [Bacteroidia bacterium]